MAAKTSKLSTMSILRVLLVLISLSCGTFARIHHLKLENDARGQIDLSTFGFLQKGYLFVKLVEFAITPGPNRATMGDDQLYGFTLDKTVSTGISPYLETKQENCILKDSVIRKDNSVSVLFLSMDFTNKRLKIHRKGKDLEDLEISLLSIEEFTNRRRHRRSFDVLSDSYLLRSRVRRDVTNYDTKAGNNGNNGNNNNNQPEVDNSMLNTTITGVMSSSTKGVSSTQSTVHKDVSTTNSTMSVTTNMTGKSATITDSMKDTKPVIDSIPMVISNGKISTHFLVAINLEKEEGLYNLFFHNCHNYLKEKTPTFVNLTVEITENNNGNFLSAGQMPLPVLYFSLSILYILTGGYWFYVLRASDSGTVFKIHYLMLVLVFVKAIALFFHSVNFYFIQIEGYHQEAFAILYYITHLMKGALLFITIVLIGAGWAFVKHILSDRDKRIFIIVIPLQVLANVAQIIIAETEEGQSQYTTWKEVFILVDLLCCGAILFPVVWSIRHLQEASGTDGKAAINLAKLKIFRHFYIMIVCYIYFTRIIVYLLKITVPFQYEWLDELFKELATFTFFVVTGYKFRPASNNPYLQVSTDSDDEIEMDEVVTKSGALDDVVRVNVKTTVSEEDVTGPSKRESSHDYD